MKKNSKRKTKYALPLDLSDDIGETITISNDNLGTMNYRLVPIASIETDPLNPRKLAISRTELLKPLHQNNLQYNKKRIELEKLQLLAETIKEYGVRNPVEIYKDGLVYRLIHGERRLFGSIIAGKKVIPAKVHEEKPKQKEINVLQLIENIQREDLSLQDLIKKLKELIVQYKKQEPNLEIDADFLHKLTFKSKTQCFYYLTVLNGPEEVLEAIYQGKIKNLRKAYVVSSEKHAKNRALLFEACIKGNSLNELTNKAEKLKKTDLVMKSTLSKANSGKRRGKLATKICLGKTKNIAVAKKIIELVLQEETYVGFTEHFKKFRLDSLGDYTDIFKELIRIMERIESNNN